MLDKTQPMFNSGNPPPLSKSENKANILVVDDDPIFRSLITTLVAQNGFHPVEAESREDAEEKIVRFPPRYFEAVFTDYQMPDGTGLELLDWIKLKDPSLSVVLVTAHDTKELVKNALRHGVFDFIEKPLTRETTLGFNDLITSTVDRTRSERKVRVGRYTVQRHLNTGGCGSVYIAWDNELQRKVALKRLRERVDSELLKQEARLCAKLQHPHIVSVYDYGTDREGSYIVMELIQGESLDELVEDDSPWEMSRLLEVTYQCLDALNAAHSIGMVHLDIKPMNIMLDSVPGGTHVKFLDFGMARMVKSPTRASSDGYVVYGSPSYVSPEQILNETVDPRTDLYSLGCTLCSPFLGHDAFYDPEDDVERTLRQHLKVDIYHFPSQEDEIRDNYSRWLQNLMRFRKENRPESAEKARHLLEELCPAAE